MVTEKQNSSIIYLNNLINYKVVLYTHTYHILILIKKMPHLQKFKHDIVLQVLSKLLFCSGLYFIYNINIIFLEAIN